MGRGASKLIEFNGKTLSAKDWGEIYGLSADTILHRMSELQWDAEKAITTPKGATRGRHRKPYLDDDDFVGGVAVKLKHHDFKIQQQEDYFHERLNLVKEGVIPRGDYPTHCKPVRCSSGMRFGW